MDTLIIGFALFSLFFGAGNLIFPPLLGLDYGTRWPIASLGFILTGVGLASIAVYSMAKKGGDIIEFTKIGGKNLSTAVSFIISLTLGPLGAIPRTGATSGEVMISSGIKINYILFILIFFSLSYVFVIRENKIIDVIGKYLTPLLLIVLFIMIIIGIINPIGPAMTTQDTNIDVFSNSILEGYNTMDAMAAIAFAPIIIQSIRKNNDEDRVLKQTLKVILIATTGLVIVYMALTYLGASSSKFVSNEISRVELLIFIANSLLGSYGKFILALMIVLACFTTSIGLISSIAAMLYRTFNQKISYLVLASIITVVSIILSLVGVDTIVKLTSPLLTFIYPIVLVMVVFNLLDHDIDPLINKLSFLIIGAIAVLGTIVDYANIISPQSSLLIENIYNKMPLSKQGLPWLIPFIILLIIQWILYTMKVREA